MNDSQISHSDYADTTKALLELVQKLTAIGAPAILDVPRVVVIGNQSAGKSSVVEAISGINVPRDSGLFRIRWEYDSDDQRRPKVIQVPFGDVITDKGDVELALRRAQFAVLNEAVDAQTVLGMSAEHLRAGIRGSQARAFSRNVVCVDLEGPELTDLSFIDLPGLIQNEEDRLVKLVESLVVDHIKGNTLILVTVPMSDDLENQKALTLARQADPDGKRTIARCYLKGLQVSRFWLEVIEGRKRPLLHGYYCTRQPDDDEREAGITPPEARQIEMAYFEATEPWSRSTHKNRFGIKNLSNMLSPLLAQIIRESLPKLSETATLELDSCSEGLKKLPAAVKEDPREHMRNLVTYLNDDFNDYAKGSQGFEGLIQDSRTVYGQFKNSIRASSPRYVPFLKSEKYARSSGIATFKDHLEGDDTDEEPCGSTSSEIIFLDDVRTHIELSITRELPDNVPFPAKVKLIVAFQKTWPDATAVCFKEIRDQTAEVLMQCVKVHFGRWDLLHSQMRSFVNNFVKKHYEICSPFIQHVLELECTPFTQNTHYLQSTREAWLAKYRSARSASITSGSDSPASRTEPEPFQFGSRAASKSGWGAVNATLPASATPSPPSLPAMKDPARLAKLLAELAEFGFSDLRGEDLKRLAKPDEYDTEMKVMAEVRSYFQVAYKRIIDYIPVTIDNKFLKGMAADIRTHLLEQLKLSAPDAAERCTRYLSEDPSVSALREELITRKATLEDVKDALDSFGGLRTRSASAV
ncbi:hypothetical protein FA95DRAFT_1611344 [Auriscalpium vulgare]|uniref:Uncharacterized protein n=1 Tax=Auriscalpium vulgare TaxID=40419 RepID=A0ACB8RAS1_9AGAM|nr:hypothetical protein FA95DRAFT_1611344 [Auriscalpium vulgare]